MSSSYIIEPQDNECKSDDTLIIVVNDDGTIAVDQETLENLIMTQSDANVSVVRIGQSEGDAENGELTFTVDPPQIQTEPESSPSFQSNETCNNSNTTGPADTVGLVDPFMEMDPEQLEKLETALQSEQAKQILGENVAAMLDMLTIEEQQNSLKHAIELDHCYTSRSSPVDPLPVDDSPKETELDTQLVTSPSPSTSESTKTATVQPVKVKTKQPVGRPRKIPLSNSQISPNKSTNVSGKTIQPDSRKNSKAEEQEDDNSFSSESSDSDTSDNDDDSDFGPRGPRKSSQRSRGGRRGGLTTRGGSIGTRRRGSGKRIELEQSRKNDNEISSNVDSLNKNGDRLDKNDKLLHQPVKKQIKTLPIRKKEELSKNITPVSSSISSSSSSSSSSSPLPLPASQNNESSVVDKPLQTTNQVKANLINANMIKGDMIVTKPGQNRNSNFKVYFVPKKVTMKPTNDVKAINSLMLNKESTVQNVKQIQTKIGTSEEGKLISIMSKSQAQPSPIPPPPPPSVSLPPPPSQSPSPPPPLAIITTSIDPAIAMEIDQSDAAISLSNSINQKQHSSKVSISSTVKIKTSEVKLKEKKKSENESIIKLEDSSPRVITVDAKTPDSNKKHIKKEQRKSPGNIVDALGPALFSTPDIIRRVGSTDVKNPEINQLINENSLTEPIINASTLSGISSIKNESSLDSDLQTDTSSLLDTVSQLGSQNVDQSSLILSNEGKNESKLTLTDDLSPSNLDPVSSATPNNEVSQTPADPVPNIVSEQSGIEGAEHLLASLDMVKHGEEEEMLSVLLFQEQLGLVDPDPATLDEQTSAISDNLLSSSVFDTAMLPSTSTELSSVKLDETHMPSVNSLNQVETNEMNKKKSVNMNEPIQIVRGGRVVTLPPMEAPTTRSKRNLQQVQQQSIHKQQLVKPETLPKANESEYEDEDDEKADSEDDPTRLWCICRQPHNNRFMICCDICQDWFHGKCVNVTKAMGSQMEDQGIDWVCPNCSKKKSEPSSLKSQKSSQVKSSRPSKTQHRHKSTDSQSSESQSSNKSQSSIKVMKSTANQVKQVNSVAVTRAQPTQCVVCKKEARNSSIFCSDDCILLQANKSSSSPSPSASTSTSTSASLLHPFQTSQIKITKTPDSNKIQSEERVVVLDKKNHKLLTGIHAPLKSNLQNWLKENPGFEPVQINSLSSFHIGGKPAKLIKTNQQQLLTSSSNQPAKMIFTKISGSKQTVLAPSKKMTLISKIQNVNILPKTNQMVISSSSPSPSPSSSTSASPSNKLPILKQTTIKTIPIAAKTQSTTPDNNKNIKLTPGKTKQDLSQSKPSTSVQKIITKSGIKRNDVDPIRLNVRKTLTQVLTARIRETDDLKLSDEEIADLVLNIELEMFKYFRDTGAKYKAKHRSLNFNIGDSKNLTLFRKIADKSLTPDAVVRLSAQEMASQELAEWREKETKHQLEMIKKNELDMMALAKSIVVKTHKGEQIIESDDLLDAVDPKTPVQDIVTVLNNTDSTSFDMLDEKEETTCSSIEDAKKKKTDDKKKKDKDHDKDRSRTKDRGSGRDSKDKRDSSRGRHHRSRDRSKDRRKSKDRKRDKEREKEKEKEKEKDRDRERERDRDREKDKNKDKDRDKSKDKKDKYRSHKSSKNNNSSNSNSSTGSNNSSSRNGKSNHSRDKEKKRNDIDEESKRESEKKNELLNVVSQAEKPVDDNLWKHIEDESTTHTLDGHDSDVSDREPSSTVNIKTPDINDDIERDKDDTIESECDNESQLKTKESLKCQLPSVWRGFISMPDVAKFCSSAQEVCGNAKDIMKDMPDTLHIGGRILPSLVWDYIIKMIKSHNKEIKVIRLTAVNDEEKIPYITLYSYLNSRDRFGVINNLSKNIKDFYIIPFSSTCKLHPALLPANDQLFEENRPPLLLGIIVPNIRKRTSQNSTTTTVNTIPPKLSRKDDRSYTPPPVPPIINKERLTTVVNPYTDKTSNKTPLGLSRNVIDSATISKIVPELSSKIDLTSSPDKIIPEINNDDDEPYSPGDIDDEIEDNLKLTRTDNLLELIKNPNELQREMNELDRKIEEERQQIKSISSSFLGESLSTNIPGLGLDPSDLNNINDTNTTTTNDDDEAYSPTDSRSFTPPPLSASSTQRLNKYTQPILDKVSNITIPANLQEILANVKRQESSKVDPYLPTKPSASFLTAMNSSMYQQQSQQPEPTYTPTTTTTPPSSSIIVTKETKKSTLGSLSDLELIKKAEEELAAVDAAKAAAVAESMAAVLHPVAIPTPIQTINPMIAIESSYQEIPDKTIFQGNLIADQPKPPGVEDDDYIPFPSTPPKSDSSVQNFTSGTATKRKFDDNNSPSKPARNKSRWSQGPSD